MNKIILIIMRKSYNNNATAQAVFGADEKQTWLCIYNFVAISP